MEKQLKIQYFIDKLEKIENMNFQESYSLMFFKFILVEAPNDEYVTESILKDLIDDLFSKNYRILKVFKVPLWDSKNTLNAVIAGIHKVYENEFSIIDSN